MSKKPELGWGGKEDPIQIPSLCLTEERALSYQAESQEGNFGNFLIHGNNLPALNALKNDFSGQVKCVYIDPPYNTGALFAHYDDHLEHGLWLTLMRARLILFHTLLREDGFLCCEIDDSEGPYLKVLLDEVFGRENYLSTLYVRVRYPSKTLKEDMAFHKEIEQIHIYRKSKRAVPNLHEERIGYEKFKFFIEELAAPAEILALGGKQVAVFPKNAYAIREEKGSKQGLKEIWATGTILDGNSSGRFFRDYLAGRYETDGYGVLYKVSGIGSDASEHRYFTGPRRMGATKGKYYQGVPLLQKEEDLQKKVPFPGFLDFAALFGNCRLEGASGFRGGKKPEALLKTLLEAFSSPGDLILDGFLGSGTTAAAAHKMGRRWIGIEIGEQAYSLCRERLKRVVDGEQTGISKIVGWKGGGGFRFYELT